jgi:hypothetical protein
MKSVFRVRFYSGGFRYGWVGLEFEAKFAPAQAVPKSKSLCTYYRHEDGTVSGEKPRHALGTYTTIRAHSLAEAKSA